MGIIVFPSVNERTVTSGPVKHSSIKILSPLFPKALFFIHEIIASLASLKFSATVTPLPLARPSAFITIGQSESAACDNAPSMLSKILYLAVGILYFVINSFAKILLLSISAAFLSGPKHFTPSASRASTAPIAKGSSGATTAKSIAFSRANSTMPSISSAEILTHSANSEIPPFPGSA